MCVCVCVRVCVCVCVCPRVHLCRCVLVPRVKKNFMQRHKMYDYNPCVQFCPSFFLLGDLLGFGPNMYLFREQRLLPCSSVLVRIFDIIRTKHYNLGLPALESSSLGSNSMAPFLLQSVFCLF